MCSPPPLAPSPGSLWPWVAPTWGPAAVMKESYVCACVPNRLQNELCCLHKASNRPHIDLWMVILKQPSLLCRRAHGEDKVIVGQWLGLPKSACEAAKVLSLAGHTWGSWRWSFSASPSCGSLWGEGKDHSLFPNPDQLMSRNRKCCGLCF